MMPSFSEALFELCGFARIACEADLVLAAEVDDDGRASTVASSPVQRLASFNLAHSGIFEKAWTARPLPASYFRLPTAIVHALNDAPAHLLFVPAQVDHASRSGLLLVWCGAAAPPPLVEHVPLLASSVSTTLTTRRESAKQQSMRDQLSDLLESVPSGIVLIDGDGRSAIINERAAELLGCSAGTYKAGELAAPMRALRGKCDNRAELDAAYAGHVANVDYAATLHWVLGERTYEVDTHPIRADGERGRIWLFTDVTAELRMAAELHLLAQSDPLTGVPNRRHFEQRFAQIVGSPDFGDRSVAVLVLDVDHFKQVNDTYGHLVGDEVLKAVAARCREALRDRDLFARFGGEEFVALLAAPAVSELPAIGDRLRLAVAASPIRVGSVEIGVTISVGIAAGRAADSSGEDVLGYMVGRADHALYRAKQSGRNCVVVADLEDEH